LEKEEKGGKHSVSSLIPQNPIDIYINRKMGDKTAVKLPPL